MKYKLTASLSIILIFSQKTLSMDKELSKKTHSKIKKNIHHIDKPAESKTIQTNKNPNNCPALTLWTLGWTGVCYGIYCISQKLNNQQ